MQNHIYFNSEISNYGHSLQRGRPLPGYRTSPEQCHVWGYEDQIWPWRGPDYITPWSRFWMTSINWSIVFYFSSPVPTLCQLDDICHISKWEEKVTVNIPSSDSFSCVPWVSVNNWQWSIISLITEWIWSPPHETESKGCIIMPRLSGTLYP